MRYQDNWGATIDYTKNESTYYYTSTSYVTHESRVSVSIKPPAGLASENFKSSYPGYIVKYLIKSISLNSKDFSNGDIRRVGDNETWEVTNVNLYPAVSEIPKASVPDSISGYQWKGWGRSGLETYQDNWKADITSDGEVGYYKYTSADFDSHDTSAAVSVSVPGFDEVRSFSTYSYDVD